MINGEKNARSAIKSCDILFKELATALNMSLSLPQRTGVTVSKFQAMIVFLTERQPPPHKKKSKRKGK